MANKIAFLSAFCGLLGMSALACPAQAQVVLSVVYVSGKGNDSAACDTVAAPCLTFQAAHNKVVAGGAIIVLDSASYGPVNITKSVSIVNAGGGVADVQQAVSGRNAININNNGAVVHLDGLSIDGGGVGAYGVAVAQALSVTVTNCVVRRFAGSGFLIRPSTLGTAISINDTIASDNAKGVYLFPNGGSIIATLSNVQAIGNSQQGVYATGAVSATIVGGTFSKSVQGVYAGPGASISVRDAVASNNSAAGFFALGGGAVLRLAHSVASGNNAGLQAWNGGVAETYSDNNLRANTYQGPGSTPVARQ